MNKTNFFAIVLVVSGLVHGCERQDSIRVYKTDKESSPVAMLPAGHPPLPQTQQSSGPAKNAGIQTLPIDFKAPAAWKALGSAGMAAAVYQVEENLNVTVTPLGAASGGVLMNVNRWEQQLGLQPTPEANLSKVATAIKIEGKDAHLVDITSAKAEGKPQLRMLAAIVPAPDAVWYFKLVGPAEKVGPQKQAFDDFVKSVKFQPSQQPVGQAADPHAGVKDPHAGIKDPHAGVADPHAGIKDPHAGIKDPHAGIKDPHAGIPMTKPVAAADAKFDGIAEFKLPEGWQIDGTPRMMRVGTILVGEGDQRADLAISRLGSFGDPLANLNRWRGQVGMQPVNDLKDQPTQSIKLGEGPMTLMDFEGPADAGAARKRMLVARSDFPNQQTTWFFRLVGPYETVAKAKPAFEAFIKSLKFAK